MNTITPACGGAPRARWIRTAIACLGLSTLIAGGGLRQDELDCEQAVAHLKECCPDFVGATIACEFSDGCGTTDPALSIDESHCILALECAALVKSGICDKTRDLESPHTEDGDFVSHPPVCQ
jgi:hypothetical protein